MPPVHRLTSHSSFLIYVCFLQITYSRDALQSIAPTATQLVKNFQSVNTVYITPHPPLVPIYLCSAYGAASVAPIDTLMLTILPPTSEQAASVCSVHSTYGIVGSTISSSETSNDSAELTTLQDFVVHTSSMMLGINKDATDSSTELQTVCRVWGLYTESPSVVPDASYVPCLQHTTGTVWRLLTVNPADYDIALSALFEDTVRSTAARNIKSRTYVEQRKCLGLMVEYTTTPYVLHNSAAVAASPIAEPDIATGTEPDTAVYSVWPTDRILHAQGHTRQPPQDSASAVNKECPFSIAEHVDVLNNNNQWCVGIVTNIARDHVPTNTDPHNVNVSITVRPLVDSDGRAVATKVPKLSGPGIRQTTEEVRNAPSDPATDITPVVDNADKIYSQARKADGGDDSGEEEGSGDEEEGSDEGSVESAIVNNTNIPITAATATVATIHSAAKASNGGEESGSEEGSSSDEDESADDNSLIRDKRSTTTAKPATNTNNPANMAFSTENNDTATAGVTWPSATGSNVIVVSCNSLRILDLGTMTSPTITYANNDNRTTSYQEAYLPKLMHSLRTVYRQHLTQQTTLNAAGIDEAVATKSTASSNVSRQPSAVPSHFTSGNITPVKAASSSNIITSPKQDSNSSFTGSKGLLFNSPGKNSVVPHTPEAFVEQEVHAHTEENQGAAVLASNANLRDVLTVSEWDKLQKCMNNVNTCAFPLRALYILLLTERLILLPPKHPHKGTVCIASGLYDANRYLYIAPSVAPEMVGVMNSADDNHSTTSYSSSNAPHYKNHPRDPISKFFKGCGKSIQRSFAPKETEVLGQTDLLNHLNSNAGANTTSSNVTTYNTSNGHSHGDDNTTTEQEPPNKAYKDGQVGPMNASTINTQTNNNANFPHQKPTTVAATIAKPQVTTSVNNIGIRIVGVAGMCAYLCVSLMVLSISFCIRIIFYVCIFPLRL